MMTIEEVNNLPSLVDDFGDVAEHAPWVAKEAETRRPFRDRAAMILAFQSAILMARRSRQLELIRAHPDLAGKAALTKDSANEQKGAGLDALTKQEMVTFNQLNAQYKQTFQFPFILAVKGATKFQILESFKKRLHNSEETEFATAIEMVCKIVTFRLQASVAE